MQMSLSISVHRRDSETGDLIDEPIDEPGATLAGFENWRHLVYGSEAMRRRGATFLPRLEHDNLWIEGPELAPFAAELERILAVIDGIANDLAAEPDGLRFRLQNMLNATRRAQAIGGAVWIS